MDQQTFQTVMTPVFEAAAGKAVDQALAADLNAAFPVDGETVKAIEAACHVGIEAGWMCDQGDEGRKFGRVIKPADDTNNFSVDVVDLTDFVGPHHEHPTGEICLTLPVDATAEFDGMGAGWCVNDPGTAHRPTVTGGRALVLYLLPDGKIRFTGK